MLLFNGTANYVYCSNRYIIPVTNKFECINMQCFHSSCHSFFIISVNRRLIVLIVLYLEQYILSLLFYDMNFHYALYISSCISIYNRQPQFFYNRTSIIAGVRKSNQTVFLPVHLSFLPIPPKLKTYSSSVMPFSSYI